MGKLREGEMIEECGSVSPSGRVCNHKKGHAGKCVAIEKGKRGFHILEYWGRENETN